MNILKRFWAFFLAIALSISGLTIDGYSVKAEDTKTTKISVESLYAKPGSNIVVKVSIKDNPGILGAVLNVSFDDEKMTLTKAENGEAFSPLVFTTPGSFTANSTFSWDGQDLSEDDVADGEILKLTFEINDDAVIGDDYNVSITYNPLDIVDADLNTVKLTVENGVVSVLNYIPGDLTDDGKINSTDVISLRRHIVGNYEQTIIEDAGDVNSDGRWNSTDVITVRRFIAGGYNVKLKPAGSAHIHSMKKVNQVDATCTEDGNIAYWHCSDCDRYYRDADGVEEIELEDTVIDEKGHTVVIDAAVSPTIDNTGLTEGSHCSECGEVLVEQIVIPSPEGYSITYNISNGDTYLAQQEIDNSKNPTEYYKEHEAITLTNLQAPKGYKFLGWYDGAGNNATQIKVISKETTGNIELYAHWEEVIYDVTYKLYQTPLAPISDEKYLHYTVSKGLADLPNPTLYNYIFLGWYDNDGNEVKKIPVGTTGNIELNAYWTSKRNLTKKVDTMEEPIILEDSDNGVIYFTYELGTIENVPLTDAIWTIQSVAGLAQQVSKTVTTSITDEKASSIMDTVSRSTVDSKSWTLSSNWNDVTTVNESWAETNGITQEEGFQQALSSSNTLCLSSTSGGTDSTTTTDGLTTIKYDSKDTTKETGSHFDVEVNGKYTKTTEVSAGVGFPIKVVDVNLGAKNTSTFEIGGSAKYGNFKNNIVNEKSGSDETSVHTDVTSSTSSWNNSQTSSSTNTASQSRTVSKALSQVISNTKGYGKSSSYGGENSESQGLSTTASESTNTTSTLSYSTQDVTTTTTTYSTDGKSEGCYRLVIAGTVHVFAVVGYDVASNSYFTHTFNVMDDKTHEFLDYSPNLSFDDCENGVLPFEVPFYVYEYVSSKIVQTNGLVFKTNSEERTATVHSYNGTEEDVVVPSYISAGNKSYKVTGIEETAFAGKDIKNIILSKHIDEIPNEAFENCSKLETISGYFTRIGNEAFNGCTSLESFNVSSNVTEVGNDAFKDVPILNVSVINSIRAMELAKEINPDLEEENPEELKTLETKAKEITANWIDSVLQTGAKKIIIDISTAYDGTEITLDTPELDYFEVVGGKKTYKNLKINSNAEETVIKEVNITECKQTPFFISSDKLTLEEVSAVNNGFVLLLANDGVEVSLIRDNKLVSNNGKAIVAKNPSFVSEVVNSVLGGLEVSGNIYYCGSLTEQINIDMNSGQKNEITSDEFEKYIKGEYILTFDPNGGVTDEETRTIYYGDQIGTMPQPTRDDCTFLGWYTLEGDEITKDDIYNFANDITVKAHWKSDWVLNSALPQDATVTNEKWTYDLTTKTTASTPTLQGYTKYNETWVWGSYGAWSGWSRNSVGGSDSRQVETKTVTDQAGYTRYNYYIYRSNDHRTYGTQGYSGVCYNYDSISINYQLGGPDGNGTYGDYKSPNCSHSWCTRWFYSGSQWVPAVTHTEYRYRDRSKVWTYFFTKTEQKESDTEIVSNNGTITNVQKWVKYIIE